MNIINKTIYLKNKLHENINNKITCVNIYKTLDSIVYQINDTLYCFNNYYYKKINIKCNSKIYSNEKFYIVIQNNSILYMDEYFSTKFVDVKFNISNVLIKNNYIIVNNDNESILINIYIMNYIMNYEMYDLYDKVLFHSENNNFIVTDLGLINTMEMSNIKVKKLASVLKKSEGLDNFINAHFKN